MTAPLRGLRFSLVGAGRVGASLARWAVAAGAELVAVAGRRPGTTAWPGGPLATAVGDLESSGQELLLVAVSDGAIPGVVAELVRHPQARVALHTSGSLDASALAPLRAAGSAVGSLHPLRAFPQPLPDPEAARGVFFAVDGDAAARELAGRLAATWGGKAAEVPPDVRPLYHFAATLAAGGVATLLATAMEIVRRLGLPEEVSRGYLELARGTVAAVGESLDAGGWPAAAITGPAARGDRATLVRHLDALGKLAPGKLPLAMFLALETLYQTGQAEEPGPHRN